MLPGAQRSEQPGKRAHDRRIRPPRHRLIGHEMRDQCERAAEPEKGCTGHFRAAPKIGQLATIPHHWSIDPPRPDRWDAVGVALALMGAGLVLYAPRRG